MTKPTFDMLVAPGECADCRRVVARGEIVCTKPVAQTACFTIQCQACAAAELLPLLDATDSGAA